MRGTLGHEVRTVRTESGRPIAGNNAVVFAIRERAAHRHRKDALSSSRTFGATACSFAAGRTIHRFRYGCVDTASGFV